jgi:vancomycin aglycone glucosyltransferase
MRVLLLTHRSRGDVEPVVGLAMRLRALGAEARVCAPPACAASQAEVSVPLPGRPFPRAAAETVRRTERV